MKEQLTDVWQLHNRMNLLLIDAITDEGMQKTLSTRGGRTIYQQWIHIHNVRMQWLEVCAKDIFKKYGVLDKEAVFDRKKLKKALQDSANGIEELLLKSWEDGGKVKGFKKGTLPLLGYLISHESHHRGNIMLTLKQTGEKIPDSVKWGYGNGESRKLSIQKKNKVTTSILSFLLSASQFSTALLVIP